MSFFCKGSVQAHTLPSSTASGSSEQPLQTEGRPIYVSVVGNNSFSSCVYKINHAYKKINQSP